METEVTLSVDPYSPPIWEGLGVELNILSEQTPRLTLTLILKLTSGIWSELGRVIEMLKVSINLLSVTVIAPPFSYSPQPLHQTPHPDDKGLWLGDESLHQLALFAEALIQDESWGRGGRGSWTTWLIPGGWSTGHITSEEP